MTCAEKVIDLRTKIETALTPLVTRDYWLLEVPYYSNIGDTLIWQGELDFLRNLPHKCKGMFSYESRGYPKIDVGDLVLFQGGGNFGDLWPLCHEYRKKIMRQNPTCRYVIFPQTVWYNNVEKRKGDAAFFSNFDVTICVRDQRSYVELSQCFKNKILLLPDMAFCMDMRKWMPTRAGDGRPLLIKRDDKELKISPELLSSLKMGNVDVADWPTFSVKTIYDHGRTWLRRAARFSDVPYEWYMNHLFRPYLVKTGVNFLAPHCEIITTRLHACILSVLMGIEKITLFDNSYGKNSGFYQTWLSNCDVLTML